MRMIIDDKIPVVEKPLPDDDYVKRLFQAIFLHETGYGCGAEYSRGRAQQAVDQYRAWVSAQNVVTGPTEDTKIELEGRQ